jgi:hypothetical protein
VHGPAASRLVRIAILLTLAALLAFSFHQGWQRQQSDFPNYYTAARLVLKHERLHNYYDWTWFQRQMNYAGIEQQLGGYIPQTPLTMLPMLPFATQPPQVAKRIWLVFTLVLLATTIWLMTQFTRFNAAQVALLIIAGFGSVHMNLLLGQYYILLLFLLTLAFYLLYCNKPLPGGVIIGVVFGLKLYGGPFLVYFAAKRQWRTALAMLCTIIGLAALAVAIFGVADVAYFATQILPRSLQGETLDPYNPGNGTIATLLRRTFRAEPELNPHPLWNAPELLFFFQPLLFLAFLLFALLFVRYSSVPKRDFAWFLIALLLASPNTASYTFVLLVLPVALLLEDSNLAKRIALVSCYVVLTFPMRPAWSWLFPKVWLLLLIFFLVGAEYRSFLRWRPAAACAALVIGIAAVAAVRSIRSYKQEPGRQWERIAVQPGDIYSSSPAVLRSGIVFNSIDAGRYILRWLHGNRIDTFVFPGEAFNPVALSADGPVRFQLVAHRTTTAVLFNPTGPALETGIGARPDESTDLVISPDKRWAAFTSSETVARHLWLRPLTGAGTPLLLAGGDCNSFDPAWELDSQGIVFASDCGRGIGLPALYRARIGALIASNVRVSESH